MTDRFTELCIKWKTPKVKLPWNPVSHDYAAVYNAAFAGRSIKKVLEIGCGFRHLFHPDYVSGGSLFMWAELFPEAQVYGIDIRNDALVNQGRIHCFICDQSSETELLNVAAKLGKDFDLIVDDGSHVPADQVLTVNKLAPLLSPNGVYIIEDALGPLDLPYKNTIYEMDLKLMCDDRLIVIEGKDVHESSEARQ